MAKDFATAFDPDGQLDADSVKVLSGALTKEDSAPFGYLEFRLAVDKLVALGRTRAEAIESVFATADAMGVSRKALAVSAKKYHRGLAREGKAFREALEKRLSSGLEADRARIAKRAAAVEKLEAQAAETARKIEEGKAELARLRGELDTVRARVEERGQRFESTLTAITGRVEADLSDLGT